MRLLTFLDLYNNNLGNLGMTHIAPAVKNLPQLQYLYLYSNGIGDDGANLLLDYLEVNFSLTNIVLNYNDKSNDVEQSC